MLRRKTFIPAIWLSVHVFWAVSAFAQTPHVVSTSPAQNELNVPTGTDIYVTFDVDMDPASINSSTLLVYSQFAGLHPGIVVYQGPSQTALFFSLSNFDEGEVVTVVLTTGIQSSEGTPLEASYIWSFTTWVSDGDTLFGPPTDYWVPQTPWGVVAADFDGDSDLDLVVPNGGAQPLHPCRVEILWNNGDGTFDLYGNYWPVGRGPAGLFAADLDGDGDVDIATTSHWCDSVSVLLNNGDSTFSPCSEYPVGTRPVALFAADLNGDGDLDLAVANSHSDNVSVLVNNGDGTFVPDSAYPVGRDPQSVFSADLDGDGDLDLATADYFSYQVSVLLNNGDATFDPATAYPVCVPITGPRSLSAADLDGDGDLDLATGIANQNMISVLLNYGDGTFAPYDPNSGIDPGDEISAADLDGDGDQDLATYSYDSDLVWVLWNNGDGTFTLLTTYPVGDAPHSILSADLDGDGDLDLATSNRNSADVSVLLNAGQTQPELLLISPDQNELNVAPTAEVSVIFNVDMDPSTINDSTFVVKARSGYLQGTISYDSGTRTATFFPSGDFHWGELVTAVLTTGVRSSQGLFLDSSYVWSFTVAVDGGTGSPHLVGTYELNGAPHSIFVADFNGDGNLDLAAPSADQNAVAVLFNDGTGWFAEPAYHPVGDGPYSVSAADLDGDNDLDLVVTNVLYNYISVLLNNGDGTFPPDSVYFAGAYPRSVFAADLDGDGDLDLATANSLSDDVSVLFNDGEGIFGVPTFYPAGGYSPYSIFAADLDGDADLDLAVGTGSDNVSVLFNGGDGSFVFSNSYPVSSAAYAVFAADLDADGDLDLANTNASDSSVSVLLNHGDGTFAAHVDYRVREQPTSIFAADLDGDEDLDLVTANWLSECVSVLLNQGNGTFDSHFDYPVGKEPYAVFAADLDQDGDMDLAAAYTGVENGVAVMFNECGDLHFRPDPDGWQFANTQENMWPESWWEQFDYCGYPYLEYWCNSCYPYDFPDWPLFVRAFGEEQCYWDPPPGEVIYKQGAVEFWFSLKEALGNQWRGSCFGFAISAFLFFDGFMDVESEFGYPDVYSVPINDESRLMQNQYWLYQFGMVQRQYREEIRWRTPTETLYECREMFRSLTRDDGVLGLISLWCAHAVNPYRCEIDSVNPEIEYIYVYDNNYPGVDTLRVLVNTVANAWYYPPCGLGAGGGLYLLDPVSNYTTYPIMPVGEWELPGDTIVQFYFSGTDTALFESPEGNIGHMGDSLFTTLSEGHPIVPFADQGMGPIGYYLPNDAWTFRLAGFTSSTFRLSMYAGRSVMSYHRSGVDSTQSEEFRCPGIDSTLVVLNPDGESRYYSLDVICTDPDSEICYGVGEMSIDHGDSSRYSIKSESELQLDNYGGTKAYDLRVKILGVATDTAFYHQDVTLPANTSHLIIPDWREYGDSLMILVDSGMVGTFSDTVSLGNQGERQRGDANGDGLIDLADVIYLLNYLFKGQAPPDPLEAGDANCDGVVELGDAIYLLNYLFKGGPPPGC